MLTSHPLELTFGGIRQCSKGNDTSENAMHAVAKSKLGDTFLRDLGKKRNPIKGRFNISGNVNSEFYFPWKIDIPEYINMISIPDEIIFICNNRIHPSKFSELNVYKLTMF